MTNKEYSEMIRIEKMKASERRTGLKLKELKKGAKHKVGKTYYCGYWGQTYEVLDYTENTGDWRGWSVTCKWQDGRVNSHCTTLDVRQDFEVMQ